MNWHKIIFALPLAPLFAVGPTREVTVTVTVPVECPACPECVAFTASDNPHMLSACMTGPRRNSIGESPDAYLRWAFRPVDKSQVCSIFDFDGDWDVDLWDVALLLREGGARDD